MAHTTFPADLPVPIDDGACKHLTGLKLPSISLSPTGDPSKLVDLSELSGLTVVFCYPRTGAPDEKIPKDWDAIPGARGCTPQACSFRDNLPALQSAGVSHLFGLSTQSTTYQQEVHDRVHLPYELLSDEETEFLQALELPFFEWNGKKLIKRLTLAIENGEIIKYWYPVFPPNRNTHQVLEWCKAR